MGGPQQEYQHVATGAFCIYSGEDPETGAACVLILRRGSHFDGGAEGYGVPGGYIDLDKGWEQPRQAAVRELAEEVLLPDGAPVLPGIAPERLVIVDSGIDYKAGRPGTLHAGTCWQAFHCALTPAEYAVLADHARKMKDDPAYAEAARAASNQETADVRLVPAADLPGLVRAGALPFAYDHERDVAVAVARNLAPPAAPRQQKKLAF